MKKQVNYASQQYIYVYQQHPTRVSD